MYVVKIDGSNNVVAWGTDSQVPDPPWYAVTDAQAQEVKDAGGLWFKGTGDNSPRWKYDPVTLALTENADTRITGTWSTTSVKRLVGMSDVTVQITLSSQVNLTNREVRFPPMQIPLALTFVDGVADVVVSCAEPLTMTIDRCADFAMVNQLEILVTDNVIRTRRR